MSWEIVKLIITFLGGGFVGALFTQICNWFRNRVQIMQCEYLEDDVQSKIHIKIGKISYNNMHLKKFRINNTTNKDIEKFAVRFVFDHQAMIEDYSSHTKSGRTVVRPNKDKLNECVLRVNDFNRGDMAEITIRIGNIDKNDYYITELESTGFRIKCIDKRAKTRKTKSVFSEKLR